MRPGTPPSILAVVVTYNSATTLPACLDALVAQASQLDGDVVVVDNGSRDQSVEIARRRGVTVVESPDNGGFAVGCNRGAEGTAAELVVLVNPDSQLDDGCLERLLAAHRALPHAGPIGGRPRLEDGGYDPRGVLGRPRLRGAVAFALGLDTAFRGSRWLDPEHGPRALPGDGLVAVEAVSGALMAVPRALWERLGGFDERFFLYGEDVDLCLRATAAGWQPVVACGAGYRHAGGMVADGTHQRRVLLYRGKVELYRQHLGPGQARVATFALQAGALLRGMAAAFAHGSRLARRAAPWRDLYRARRQWRAGHEVVVSGRRP